MLSRPTRLSLKDQVEEILKAYIAGESLRPNDRLPPQRDLAEVLQVSRTVVREAVSSLEAQGIVRARHGDGVIVIDPGRVQSYDLSGNGHFDHLPSDDIREFRSILHLMTIDLLCDRITDAELEELTAILDRVDGRLKAGKTVFREVCDFFWKLIEYTKNSVVIQLKPLYEEFARRGLVTQPWIIDKPTEKAFENLARHRAIVDALRNRDSARVRNLIAEEMCWTRPVRELAWGSRREQSGKGDGHRL